MGKVLVNATAQMCATRTSTGYQVVNGPRRPVISKPGVPARADIHDDRLPFTSPHSVLIYDLRTSMTLRPAVPLPLPP